MPRPLKIYQVTARWMPAPQVLGVENHVRDVRLVVTATTKVEAHKFLAARGFEYSYDPRDLRIGMGNDIEAVAAAGLLAAPDIVLAWPRIAHTGAKIARVAANRPRVSSDAGHLVAQFTRTKSLTGCGIELIDTPTPDTTPGAHP